LILSKYSGPEFSLITHQESGVYRDGGNRRWFWLSHRLPARQTKVGEDWTLLTMVPESQILAVASQSFLIHLALGSVTLVGALAMGFWLANRLSFPIVEAAEAAHRVANGDVASRINESGPAEITRLAGAFNQMVEEVADHRHRLEQLVEARTASLEESRHRSEALSAQLQAAFESTREAILIVRPDGTVMAANGRFAVFFGLPPADLTGAAFETVANGFFSCFADPSAMRSRWQQEMGNHEVALDQEWEVVAPERRIIVSYTAPVTSCSGNSGYSATSRGNANCRKTSSRRRRWRRLDGWLAGWRTISTTS
jgi:PAS domain-containing protein